MTFDWIKSVFLNKKYQCSQCKYFVRVQTIGDEVITTTRTDQGGFCNVTKYVYKDMYAADKICHKFKKLKENK